MRQSLIIAALLLLYNCPNAADQTWDGVASGGSPSGTDWGTGTNWVGDPADADVPGFEDVATFDTDSVSSTTIDLGAGGITTGGIVFSGSGASSFTLGQLSEELTLFQIVDTDESNDADVIVSSSVTADQIIQADVILGDGDGSPSFRDEIDVTNLSTTADLIFTGTISTGSKVGAAGNLQFLRLQGPGVIDLQGDIGYTAIDSATGIQLFVEGSGETKFGGNLDVSAPSNYLRTAVREGGTLTVTGNLGEGFVHVRNGTMNLNESQTFANGLLFGDFTQGNGDANIQIASGKKIALSFINSNTPVVRFREDDGFANTATISGGEIEITSNNSLMEFEVRDHSSVSGPELTISSDFAATVQFANLLKTGDGTLLLTGTNNRTGNNGLHNIHLEAGILQFEQDSNLGDAFVQLGTNIGAGTLEFVGTSDVTVNNRFRIGQNNTSDPFGGTILANGNGGAITFDSGARFNDSRGNGVRTLTLGGTNTGTNTIAGPIVDNGTGALSLVKQDSGAWNLDGANTYTGSTTVSSGTLLINGSTAASSNVTVESSGTLGGNGTVGGTTTVNTGATLTAGTAGTIDTLAFSGDLTLQSGSTWLLDLVNSSTSADLVDVGGQLTLNGADLDVTQLSGVFENGFTYTIASYGSLVAGTFSNDSSGIITSGGRSWEINYGTGTNSEITLTAVPEPTTFLLLLPLLLAGLYVTRRHKHQMTMPVEATS